MSLAILHKINSKGKIRPTKKFHIGLARDLQNDAFDPSNIKDFYINASDRSKHIGCMGATQMGKSRLIEYMIEQDIKAGNNLAIIDPKGDAQLLSKTVQASAESGRLNDLMLVTPIYPQQSLKIDPLAYYYAPDELVDHTISGIKAKEEYFINVASEITTVIVEGLIALEKSKGNKNARLNFLDIKNWSTYHDLVKFKDSITYLINNPDPSIRYSAEETVRNIEQILQSPQDFFAKVSSSLRTTLTALTSGTTGKIIGKAKTNEFIKRFEEGKGCILYCNTGQLLARRTAHIIGRVLISMIQSMAGRFFASGRKINPPLSIYIDEGHNVLYRGIQELFNKGGSAGIWLNFFTQSMSQMIEEVGDDITASIIDNIHIWFFMRVNHEETARYIEESTPIKYIRQPILAMAGGKIGVSLRTVEQRLVLKEKVIKLKPQWMYIRKDGKVYKCKIATVKPPYIKIEWPDIKVL